MANAAGEKFFDSTELNALVEKCANAFNTTTDVTLTSDEALRICMLACSYLGERESLSKIMPSRNREAFTKAAHLRSQILLTANCPDWSKRVFPAS